MEGKISFSFSKTAPRNLQRSNQAEEEEKDQKTEHEVLEFNDKTGTLESEGKKTEELVIPLITKNKWQVASKKNVKLTAKDELEDAAAKEILQALNKTDADEELDDQVIPLLLQNKIPEGFETDDKLDVSLRSQEPTIEDYDKIPVEAYGMAMLRGMGYKEGEAVGPKGNLVLPESTAPTVRPQGMGLGADVKPWKNQDKSKNSKEEKLKVGSYVYIAGGSHKGQFGQVENVKIDDMGRMCIKLIKSGDVVNVSEMLLTIMSEDEFKKERKVLNKESYEEHKKAREESMKNGSGHDSERKSKKHKSKHSDSDSERESSSQKHHSKKKSKKHSRDSDYESKSKSKKHKDKRREYSEERSEDESKPLPKTWIRSDLIVRFVNKDYKNGKYYKSKVVIIDVHSLDSCSCRTDDGIFLDDIPQTYLETVIPRDDSQNVMIVEGPHAGMKGEIIERSRDKYEAVIQVLPDREVTTVLSFDSICDYVKSGQY